ncbi:MAG: hypothetical protein ACFE9L_12860 [Candidatus Hodarchaeota archaeon]
MIIEDMVTSWGSKLLEWYLNTFMRIISLEMLLIQLELLVVIYLVAQVLGFIFPFLKRLMIAVFIPFRFLHMWLHLQAAQKIGLLQQRTEDSLINAKFLTSMTGDDRISLGIKTPKTTREAYRIATAPTKGAIVLIGLSFLLSPLFLLFGIIGLFIHLYILLGSLTTLWGDGKDYLFVYQTALLNSDLPPRYVAWIVIVFGSVLLGTFFVTADLLKALLTAIGGTIIYLLVLLWLASRMSGSPKIKSQGKENIKVEISTISPFPEINLSLLEGV